MSWQAVEAVRLCSKARCARRAVLFAGATYAGKDGRGSWAKLDTLEEGAGASRDTVVQALQDAVARGEIIKTGVHSSGSNIYSYAPLVDAAKALFADGDSSPSELLIVHPVNSDSSGELGDSSGAEHKPPVEPSLPSGNRPLAAGEPSLSDLVDDVFNYWKQRVGTSFRNPRLTPKRRDAIERGLGHYETDELKEAIGAWELSDWFAGRKADDGKVRNDLFHLLATDESIEELREAGYRDGVQAILAEEFGS